MLTDPKHLAPALPLSRDGPPQAHYILDDRARLALRMAWATGRPLLVVGEAGCGKTQLAWALACAWHVPLFKQVVNAQSKAEDLLYHFDAVARLADAQIHAHLRGTHDGDVLDPQHYLRPGPLWWAWHWQQAEELLARRPKHRAAPAPEKLPGWSPAQGSVVLIDEIDKAPVEVPEGLLEVLDGGSFDIPWTGARVDAASPIAAVRPPMVIITSNGARELPDPFLRRCIVLAMAVPDTDLEAWLQLRARAHFADSVCADAVSFRAAQLIADDRARARVDGRYIAGVAEYLDLLKAVLELLPGASHSDQMTLLAELAPAVTVDKGKAVVA